MKVLNFELPDLDEIEINGIKFDIMKEDNEINEIGAEFFGKYSELKDNDNNIENSKKMSAAKKEAITMINAILGDDAVTKISGGRKINTKIVIEILTAIVSYINGKDDEKTDKFIAEKYE